MYDEDYYDEEEWAERVERFADPGGDSALYAAGNDNDELEEEPEPDRLSEADWR